MAVASGELPEGLDRDRHLEPALHWNRVWSHRALIALVVAVPALALLNVFGQRVSTTTTAAPAATLSVDAPARLRGGLLYQTAFTVTARRAIKDLQLVLSTGWFDGLTLNTTEPAATGETSRNGSVSLSYGKLDAGHRFVVFADWQVNPTTVAHRGVDADVYDGPTLLAHVHRTLTVFP